MSDRAAEAASFLGTGWSFPPEFSRGGGEVAVVSDVADVHQALMILFMTRAGERPMQESFGCNLDAHLFAEVDQALVNRITSMIHDAILAHEPRVRLLGVDVSPDSREHGVLRVAVDYAILTTNSRYNLVFPFYLNEAVAPGIASDGLRAR